MEFHRNNHYIPQFYLNYWAKEKHVKIHRNVVSHENVPLWELKNIKKIGFYSDLYTDIIEGSETDEIERWFDIEYENPFKPIIEKIYKGTLLTENEYKVITKYMFSQHVRTPKFIKNNQHIWRNTAEKAINESAKRISDGTATFKKHEDNKFEGDVHIPLKAELVKDTVENATFLEIETHVGRGFWLFGMKHLLLDTFHKLPEYKWSIIQAPQNQYWLTSDNPVAILNRYERNEYDLKGGFGKNGCEILFPVTPYHMLYTMVGAKNPKYINPSIDSFERMTKIICENSDEMIIAKREISNEKLPFDRLVDSSMKNSGIREWIKEQKNIDTQYYKKR